MGVVIIAVVATLVGVGAGFFKSPPKATPARPTARTSSKPTSPPAAPLDAAPTIATLVTTYGAGLFTRPQVLALDPAGNMYVADSTGRLQQLDPSGKLVRVIPVPDRTAGSNGIHGLACSSSDALYVSRGNEVLKLSLTDGSVLSTVKAKPRVDSTQPLPDELCARGIALDASNDLYVANECTPQGMNMRVVDPHSVTKLDPRGRVLGHWNDIEGVERAMAVDGAGSLYRAYHDEMYVHAPDGRLMSKWGKSGDGLGEFPSHPVALAADGHGHVYVAFFSRRISVYDANGTWRGTFAARGQAMAFGPGGDLYVLEDDAIARYQVTLPN
jgi:DNA-binding beta-propeller fold protein YncE